jgi:hypothetical protein
MNETEPFEFPDVLDPTKTYYPPELFDEREIEVDDETTRYERLDDSDIPVIMAKFAVLKAVGIGEESTHIKIARDEGCRETLMSSIRKMQNSAYDNYDGTEMGDIELAAVTLDIYDLVFPLAPETKKRQKALDEERLRDQRLAESAEAIADAYEQSIDESDLLAYSPY